MYLYCKAGHRSLAAISYLRRLGYKNRLINIKGGMDAFLKENIPIVKP